MAGIFAVATKNEIATGTSVKTVLQITAAANHRTLVHEVSVAFQGSTISNAPVLVEVLRQTTAGTATSLTPVKENNNDDETIQTTASHTATAEPTAGDILRSEYVHPMTGFTWQAQFGKALVVPGSGRLGIRVTAANDVDCAPTMRFEE